MGRNPISDVPKTNTLRILLTPRERRQLDRLAKMIGKPTSTWARELLLASKGKG